MAESASEPDPEPEQTPLESFLIAAHPPAQKIPTVGNETGDLLALLSEDAILLHGHYRQIPDKDKLRHGLSLIGITFCIKGRCSFIQRGFVGPDEIFRYAEAGVLKSPGEGKPKLLGGFLGYCKDIGAKLIRPGNYGKLRLLLFPVHADLLRL